MSLTNTAKLFFNNSPKSGGHCALVNSIVIKTDYIIAGGGCAGMTLALALVKKNKKPTQILIIDQESKNLNDKTWCFWAKEFPYPMELAHHYWENLSFGSDRKQSFHSIAPYKYYMIRSKQWYAYMKAQLQQSEQVTFITQKIDDIGEDGISPYVLIDSEKWRASKVINSCIRVKPQASTNPSFFLWQHFKGYRIETDTDTFEPTVGTLMDFRTEQKGNSRFFYVLPFNKRKALVEYTIFSSDLITEKEYDYAFREYMASHYPGVSYQVNEVEKGKIPMTNRTYPRYYSPNVINIGTISGVVKPTTGYAFLRIQEESQIIAQKLVRGESIHDHVATKPRFAFYDRLLLQILQQQGGKGKKIFSSLFHNNPISRILTFLSEQSYLKQEALIFLFLPKAPFLHALADQSWLILKEKLRNTFSNISMNKKKQSGPKKKVMSYPF